MTNGIGNYLRLHRRRWGLTQAELAFLFGYQSDAIVSRFERRERRVTLAIAFACQLIFGVEPKDIYPALLEQVEDGVVRRMYELYSQLKTQKPSQRTAVKLRLLQDALARATKGAGHENI